MICSKTQKNHFNARLINLEVEVEPKLSLYAPLIQDVFFSPSNELKQAGEMKD